MPSPARCPLCGAHIAPAAWLDACDELLDADHGILTTHCPACQGRLELQAQPDGLQLGYRNGTRFDAALTLDYPGLQVETGTDRLHLRAGEREWVFVEDDA